MGIEKIQKQEKSLLESRKEEPGRNSQKAKGYLDYRNRKTCNKQMVRMKCELGQQKKTLKARVGRKNGMRQSGEQQERNRLRVKICYSRRGH